MALFKNLVIDQHVQVTGKEYRQTSGLEFVLPSP
jgi:hypothetical protein